MKFITNSAIQTMQRAEEFAKTLRGGETILLSGRLGSGKTVFSKGIAKGLEIREEITSPTFTIMNVYTSGKKIFCHCDAYRLGGEVSPAEIGLLDYMGREDTICLIEWPEQINIESNEQIIKINIRYLDEDKREITFERF